MDELDRFWNLHFGEPPSGFERALIWRFSVSLGVEDPVFALIVMLVRNLYETLGSDEKAILKNGPALGARMEALRSGLEHVSTKLSDLLNQLTKLSVVSVRLIETYQEMDRLRDFQSRWAVIPDWLKFTLTAGATVAVMLAGALAFAILT